MLEAARLLFSFRARMGTVQRPKIGRAARRGDPAGDSEARAAEGDPVRPNVLSSSLEGGDFWCRA